jgi:hypothetical protein
MVLSLIFLSVPVMALKPEPAFYHALADTGNERKQDGKTTYMLLAEMSKNNKNAVSAMTGATVMVDGREWKGTVSSKTEQIIKVITGKEEWVRLWGKVFNKQAPAVDFDKYVIACIFPGHPAKGLYSIRFGRMHERNNKVYIPYSMELIGPLQAIGQYQMKIYRKGFGKDYILEDRSQSYYGVDD